MAWERGPRTMARPFPARRLLAGLLGGLAAGFLLHLAMVPYGAFEAIAAALGVPVQAAMAGQLGGSVLLGALFAALPVAGWARGVGLGLLYGAAVWLVVDLALVRGLAGLSLDAGRAELLGLAGRLVWGLALGLAYVAVMLATLRGRAPRRATA